MIKLTIGNGSCDFHADGGKLECINESIMAFVAITEAVANAAHMSFDSAALMVYQNGTMAKKKHDEVKKNGT